MNITDRVSAILDASLRARNSDKELLIIYMQKSGVNLNTAQIDAFRRMPSPETIRRTRQKLQQQGLFPASKQIVERRFKQYQTVKQEINHAETGELLENTKLL